MKSYWTTHQGKRIFIAEFSHCGTDADLIHEECEAIKAALANEPPRSVLAVTNLTETFVNEVILRTLRELLPITNRYVKRRAIIGLSGFRKHFIFLVSRFVGDVDFSPFETLNEALAWIVQESQ